jgi:hypothetical protein
MPLRNMVVKTSKKKSWSTFSMYTREREVVNEDFINRQDVYNIKRGGDGGFEPEHAMRPEEATKYFKEKYNTDPKFRELVVTNLKKAREIYDKKYPEGWWIGQTNKKKVPA